MSNPCAGGTGINNVEKLVRTSPHEASTDLDYLPWTSAAQDTLEKVSGIGNVLKQSWALGFCLVLFGLAGKLFVVFGGRREELFLIIIPNEKKFFSLRMDAAELGKLKEAAHSISTI